MDPVKWKYLFIPVLLLLFFSSDKTNGDASSSIFMSDFSTNDNSFIPNFKPNDFTNNNGFASNKLKRSVNDVLKRNITVKETALNDSHQKLMVHWARGDSVVLICLARDIIYNKSQSPISSSSVYFSYDYGDSFKDMTENFKINKPNATYASVDKVYIHPQYASYIVFADAINQVIFISQDYGKTIYSHDLPFSPQDFTFHPETPHIFFSQDKTDPKKQLWISRNSGATWSVCQEYVQRFFLVSFDENSSKSELVIERKQPTGKSTIILVPDKFEYSNTQVLVLLADIEYSYFKSNIIFATKKNGEKDLDLFVAFKKKHFTKAIFNSELDRLDYHIADVTENRAFIAVRHSATFSHLYVSNLLDPSSERIQFFLSLEKILCFFPSIYWGDPVLRRLSDEVFADLHRVEGMRGIYIASQSQYTNESNTVIGIEHLVTVITFNWGSDWRPLNPPAVDDEGQPIICRASEGCSLHLSHKFAQLYPLTRNVPIMSSKSAPGIILATGSVGNSLKNKPGIYLSRDAGLTWKQIFKDLYFYNMGDHGGILVAVKYFKTHGETREILYSTDEGETWQSAQISSEDLKMYGLLTEPESLDGSGGGNTTIFTMFGSVMKQHKWLIIKVDLRNAFASSCTKDDYKMWSPSGRGGERMPCIMGRKETYERRIPHSNCFNGKKYDRPKKIEICECDLEDYQCDVGFIRNMQSHQCIRDKVNQSYDPYQIPSSCKPGAFYNRTKGYVHIPQDACQGGFEQHYLPDVIPCPYGETKEFLLLAQKNKILRFDLTNMSQLKPEPLPVADLNNVIAIEFDLKNNCLFWADIMQDVISRQCFGDGKHSQEIIVESNLSSVEGMSYDWISHLLYFVDGYKASIQVVRTDISHGGRMRKTIIGPNKLKKPRGIVVHPRAGYLYWTDWADGEPSVSRANLDGSDVQKLFTKPTVHWPNGITIDYIAERVYWVDAYEDYIASCDLHGRHFKKILSNNKFVSHPFAVTVFKDMMYWDDWSMNGIFSADKDHGFGVEMVASNLTGLMDLKLYAHSIQEGTNKCTNQTACSHLCFSLPNEFACGCPDNLIKMDNKCLCPGSVQPYSNGTCPSRGKTCSPDHFACSNGNCVPFMWRCDGDDDCGDASDEIDCKTRKCPPRQFTCASGGACIPMYWQCDFENDCADGSDEKNCTISTCSPSQFQCKNGRCISHKWVCDSEDDCRDKSDEMNCPTKTGLECKPEEIKCADNTTCIPKSYKCDGEEDCKDGSDEIGCLSKQCSDNQFECENSKCIYKSWVCDGDNDCKDGSDEKNCTTPVAPISPSQPSKPNNMCQEWMFKCNNKRCIPYWWKCDTVNDCGDNSDELECPNNENKNPENSIHLPPEQQTCKHNMFQCFNGQCILNSNLCDGVSDCDKGEDEENCESITDECHSDVDQFKCKVPGVCIPIKQVCDGISQCPDSSDEVFCPYKPSTSGPVPVATTCNLGFFPCDGSQCYPLSRLCDGHQDCYDGIDEKNCSNNTNKIYQVVQIVADYKNITSTSLPIYWWIPVSHDTELEFMPSISASNSPHWTNKTWTTKLEYKFEGLVPYTAYNITIYVRVKGYNSVYPPAKFAIFKTSEATPSPPMNLTVQQLSASEVSIKWLPPIHPNGLIQEYDIYMIPPLPPIVKHTSKTDYLIEANFEENKNYTFWVIAKNSDYESNSSKPVTLEFDKQSLIDSISGLKVVSKTEQTVMLEWNKVKAAEGYRITSQTKIPFPKHPEIYAVSTSYNVTNLAPGVRYVFDVCAYNRRFQGTPSTIVAETPGQPLPVVKGLQGEVVKAFGTTVKLSWEAAKYYRKEEWQYGVYFANDMKNLFEGAKITTHNLTATIRNLEACESYLFDIGLVGPLGPGPLASPLVIVTNFNAKAPPKDFKVAVNPTNNSQALVTWSSSCLVMREAVGYTIYVSELTKGHENSKTFNIKSTNSSQLHFIFDSHYGAYYNISVSTSVADSIVTRTQTFWAPPLPIPHQFEVFPEKNGSYVLYWKEKDMPSYMNNMKFSYIVLVSEGQSLNLTEAKEYKVASAPYILTEVKDGVSYSFGVQLVTADGYRSGMSEVYSMGTPLGFWSNTIKSQSVVGMILFSLIILTLFAGLALLGVYGMRRRRRNFTQFVNSHYDSRSGSATFMASSHLEDEEDTPVIQSFADDEPLVVA